MGPDLSYGIIIEIDNQKGMIYIKDNIHEGMIVRDEIANCQKGETFIVGDKVFYPLLYNEHPTAARIHKQSMFTSPAAQQNIHESKMSAWYNKWLMSSSKYKPSFVTRRFTFWFYFLSFLFGMLLSYLDIHFW